MLDIDGPDGKRSFAELQSKHPDQPLPTGPQAVTGGGGRHHLYQATGINNKAGFRNKLDWRGAGGYIVAPPSTHISGRPYIWDHTPDTALHPVPAWMRDILQPKPARTGAAGGTVSFLPPLTGQGTRYGLAALDAELGELGQAVQGTRNHALNLCAFNLYQLVAARQLEERLVDDRLLTVATSIGLGDHEIRQTMASARGAGLAQPREIPERPARRIAVNGAPPIEEPEILDAGYDTYEPPPEVEPTGWERVDLSPWLDGNPPDNSPKAGWRTDGQAILYPGKIHSFNGEPESGKSLCAQHLCVAHIAAGDTVLYLDFEDGPSGVVERLKAMGADLEHIRERFHYHQISNQWSVEACQVVDAVLAGDQYTVAVLDGVTEAMMLCGQSPRDESDVTKFWNILPRRLARSGAATLLIDHVVKDAEDRGRWAIGSEHKLAAIDGSSFTLESVTPFGRNKTGMARLIITKDRPAYLRQHCENGKVMAEFHVKSTGETMDAELRSANSGAGRFVPTVYMERVSAQLARGPALNITSLRAAVRGKAGVIDLAVTELVHSGYVHAEKQGVSTYYSNKKPYPDPIAEGMEQHEQF